MTPGLILGPNLWNLVLDSLFHNLAHHAITFMAYGDDLLVIVTGDTHLDIECQAQVVTAFIEAWFRDHHLLSTTLTFITG